MPPSGDQTQALDKAALLAQRDALRQQLLTERFATDHAVLDPDELGMVTTIPTEVP